MRPSTSLDRSSSPSSGQSQAQGGSTTEPKSYLFHLYLGAIYMVAQPYSIHRICLLSLIFLPIVYHRAIRHDICFCKSLAVLWLLTFVVSTISLAFAYQNLAVSKYHSLNRRPETFVAASNSSSSFGQPSYSGKRGNAASLASLEERKEVAALYYSMAWNNLGFALLFFLISWFPAWFMTPGWKCIIGTAMPSFIVSFLNRPG